ncbi:MAG: 30S ribosomal protein S16 [Chlamydiales bacterium]|nr:30S ribosomal protein S16 [Chlamydiales bacterium]
MALKIRLRQQGRNNRPFYRLVLADEHSKRDGKYHENLGWYNPFEEEQDKLVSIKADRVQHWISHGVQVSERATALLAKVAPHVVAFQREKEVAKRAKVALKRKSRKAGSK